MFKQHLNKTKPNQKLNKDFETEIDGGFIPGSFLRGSAPGGQPALPKPAVWPAPRPGPSPDGSQSVWGRSGTCSSQQPGVLSGICAVAEHTRATLRAFLAMGRGEGNGNPLQYSCLENPVDRGAWWAAVHRVAQSQTRLKRLSMHACTGEGNGNPLQYSCLENPVDRGVWWAAVHRVAQSRTRLKWLSMHACTGEGNGNPLQFSCLENPRDRGAWWAAVYGVT